MCSHIINAVSITHESLGQYRALTYRETAQHIAMQVKKGVELLVPQEADLQRHVRIGRQGIRDREKGDQSTCNLHIGETKMHTQYDLLICFWWGWGATIC